jgi:hypothetical protein
MTTWLRLRSLTVARSCSHGLILFMFGATYRNCTKTNAVTLMFHLYFLITYACYEQTHASIKTHALRTIWDATLCHLFPRPPGVLKENCVTRSATSQETESLTQARSLLYMYDLDEFYSSKVLSTPCLCCVSRRIVLISGSYS